MRAVTELGHLRLQAHADPRHRGLRNVGLGNECIKQIVDFAGWGATDASLHHHREQRLVAVAAALRQRWEKRPVPQLRDPEVQVPGRGGNGSGAAPLL